MQLAFFCIKMAFFDVSAHTLHSLGQVTVTVRRLAQTLNPKPKSRANPKPKP